MDAGLIHQSADRRIAVVGDHQQGQLADAGLQLLDDEGDEERIGAALYQAQYGERGLRTPFSRGAHDADVDIVGSFFEGM